MFRLSALILSSAFCRRRFLEDAREIYDRLALYKNTLSSILAIKPFS